MKKLGWLLATACFAGAASAQLSVSIALRETGTTAGIGANGGTTGGIEFVNLDAAALPVDDQWHLFSFDLSTATYTAFAGATANGVLDGSAGTLEHVRIRNSGGYTPPLKIWIDDVANTVTPPGGGPNTTTFGTFEGYADNAEVMFQEPRYSGSTSANLTLLPNFSGVDNTVSHSGSASMRSEFQFVSGATSNWLRLTTFNATNQPNPTVSFVNNSVVSLWIRAVPEPATTAALAFGLFGLVLRKRRK